MQQFLHEYLAIKLINYFANFLPASNIPEFYKWAKTSFRKMSEKCLFKMVGECLPYFSARE